MSYSILVSSVTGLQTGIGHKERSMYGKRWKFCGDRRIVKRTLIGSNIEQGWRLLDSRLLKHLWGTVSWAMAIGKTIQVQKSTGVTTQLNWCYNH